jgi:hypothetical protein
VRLIPTLYVILRFSPVSIKERKDLIFMGDVYIENHTERCVYVDILKKCMCKVICERVKMICVYSPQVQHVHVRIQVRKRRSPMSKVRHGHGEARKWGFPNYKPKEWIKRKVEAYTWSVCGKDGLPGCLIPCIPVVEVDHIVRSQCSAPRCLRGV